MPLQGKGKVAPPAPRPRHPAAPPPAARLAQPARTFRPQAAQRERGPAQRLHSIGPRLSVPRLGGETLLEGGGRQP